jgi:hypothetical protein
LALTTVSILTVTVLVETSSDHHRSSKESAMTTTITNAAPRKQLSDQLDRLDTILDGLGEGLNEAIADAAREGTRLAVKDAIVEILTDPTLRARLHETTAPEAPPQPERKPGFWARLKSQACQITQAVRETVSNVVAGAVGRVHAVTAAAGQVVRRLPALAHLKNLALVGLGVGVTMSVVSYYTPHAVAVVLSGVSGAVAAAAIHAGVWMRRTFRALTAG